MSTSRISPEEREKGYVLSCSVIPEGDLVVEVTD
jgi:hypothetical protein